MLTEELRQSILIADIASTVKLLDATNDITQRFAFNNETIWHAAVKNQTKEHIQLLRTLLKKYIPVNGPQILNVLDQNGLAPIHLAAIYGNIEAIKLLVSYGVDPEAKCQSKLSAKTPLELLSHYGHSELTHPMLIFIIEKENLRKSAQLENTSYILPEEKHHRLSNRLMEFSKVYLKPSHLIHKHKNSKAEDLQLLPTSSTSTYRLK